MQRAEQRQAKTAGHHLSDSDAHATNHEIRSVDQRNCEAYAHRSCGPPAVFGCLQRSREPVRACESGLPFSRKRRAARLGAETCSVLRYRSAHYVQLANQAVWHAKSSSLRSAGVRHQQQTTAGPPIQRLFRASQEFEQTEAHSKIS